MHTNIASTLALTALFLTAALGLQGCTPSYRPPGDAANFASMGLMTPQQRAAATDPAVRQAQQVRPLAVMPTRLAVVRVQAPDYSSYCSEGYGSGRYSVVPLREGESQELTKRLQLLPQVSGLVPISTLLLPQALTNDEPLRVAAGRLGADVVAMYTVATRFSESDFAPPLSLITLGLFPTRSVEVRATASALIIDTRSGYIYTAIEGSAKAGQPANGWTTAAAADDSRLRAEHDAITQLVVNLEQLWPGVVMAANNANMQPIAHDLPRWPSPQPVGPNVPHWEQLPATSVTTPPGTTYPTNPR